MTARAPEAHFNGLSPDEDERLALLLEEMGESLQVIGKIMRHGYESYDPTNASVSPTNRELLEEELGHVRYAIDQMTSANDVNGLAMTGSMKRKAARIGRWLHHQQGAAPVRSPEEAE